MAVRLDILTSHAVCVVQLKRQDFYFLRGLFSLFALYFKDKSHRQYLPGPPTNRDTSREGYEEAQ